MRRLVEPVRRSDRADLHRLEQDGMARVHLISPFEHSVTMLYDRSTGNRDESVQQAMTALKYKRLAPDARAAELVEAGLRVLSKGGITAFTIDNICKASGASRGLVGHQFSGKDGLLTACYAAAHAP